MGWKSIIQENPNRCFLCGGKPSDRHHCLSGSRRKKAEEDGLYVALCRPCHEDVHFGKSNAKDLYLKSIAQQAYEIDHTHEEFRERYGKSYDQER